MSKYLEWTGPNQKHVAVFDEGGTTLWEGEQDEFAAILRNAFSRRTTGDASQAWGEWTYDPALHVEIRSPDGKLLGYEMRK